MKTSTLLITVTIVSLTACSTYKPRNEGYGKMGYEESRLDDGAYQLSYYGSSLDNEEDVKEKWHKRATELCGVNKYQSTVSMSEWTYDGYTVIPPLLFMTKGTSPLVEGKLSCNTAYKKS